MIELKIKPQPQYGYLVLVCCPLPLLSYLVSLGVQLIVELVL